MKPYLAITLGDPAGCGPRLAVLATQDKRLRGRCHPILMGDAWILHRHVKVAGIKIAPILQLAEYREGPGRVNILHVPHPDIGAVQPGLPSQVGGESAFLTIRTAVALALAKQVTAVVTGPVAKESFRLGRLPYPGHTEILAALSGVEQVEMVMMAGHMRALLITRHMALSRVSAAITRSRVVDSITRTHRWAQKNRISGRGKWVLCGLNPHAGDHGLLGNEEQRVLAPALKTLRRRGISIEGPLPADSAWASHRAGQYDFVACLYHDQGMIPLKTVFPRRVVNATAGLPFVRTSPGHGTAFDLSGGRIPYRKADPEATVQACLAALQMAAQP